MPPKKDNDPNGQKSRENPGAEEGGEGKRGRPFHPEDSADNQQDEKARSVGIGVPVSAEEYARLKREAQREGQAESDESGQEDDSG